MNNTPQTFPSVTELAASELAAPASTFLSADPRLCVCQLPGLSVELICRDGSSVSAAVRAASKQDLVLILPAEAACDIGDIVSFSLSDHGDLRATDQSGVVHWKIAQNNAMLIAVFTVGHMDEFINDRLIDDRRLEIRFPTHIPVKLRNGGRLIDGRIVNYSLNGIGLVCSEPLKIHSSYLATGASEDTEIRLTIETQWQTPTSNGVLLGCSLEARHGVLLARRHPADHYELQCGVIRDIARGLSLPAPFSVKRSQRPAAVAEPEQRQVESACAAQWLKSATPVLSAFAVGQSMHAQGPLRHVTFLTGLIGVIASLVFTVLERNRVRR